MIFNPPPDPNTLLVLRCIWLNPRISRLDVSRIIGLDQSTISRIVAVLLDNGLVEELDEGQSGPHGGRRPVHLRVNPNYGCIIGLELSSDAYNLVGIDFMGEIKFLSRHEYPRGHGGVVELYRAALAQAGELAAKHGLPLRGIGVGLPGIIDSSRGVIVQSIPLEIAEPLDFLAAIGPQPNLAVRIEHDARCCCWGELAHHRGRCPADFIYVLGEFRRNRLVHQEFQGIALGLGLVLNNRVHAGQDHSAGEFRSVFYDGPNKNNIFGIPDADLARLECSAEVQRAFARELGRNLALLVNVLNVNTVFVGGSLGRLGPSLLETIGREIRDNWTYRQQSGFRIAYTELSDKAVAYGAAAMFLESIFAPPDSNLAVEQLIDKQK